MATATQEPQARSVTVKLGRPEAGAEPKRYTSLDAYRGFIMLILASEGFGFSHCRAIQSGGELRAGLTTCRGKAAFSGT